MNKNNQGFSLLELGVVVICIGILSTVFLYGKSLISASKLNKEVATILNYRNQVGAFSEKYGCIPGDCSRASNYMDAAECTANNAPDPTGCNGDGNGQIRGWETFKFWTHLEMTGFLKELIYIEKAYRPSTFSKVANYMANYGEPDPILDYKSGVLPNLNMISFAANLPGLNLWGSVLTPLEAESLDKKIDNGDPSTGSILGFKGDTVGTIVPKGECLASNAYNISNEGISCFVVTFFDNN